MTITFLVGPGVEGGGHEISFWVNTPSGTQLVKEERMENGDFSFTATEDGTYRYCFSNEFDSSPKELSFNVHGTVFVAISSDDADPLEKEVRTLGELLQQVKDEQEYLKIRERTHRNSVLLSYHR